MPPPIISTRITSAPYCASVRPPMRSGDERRTLDDTNTVQKLVGHARAALVSSLLRGSLAGWAAFCQSGEAAKSSFPPQVRVAWRTRRCASVADALSPLRERACRHRSGMMLGEGSPQALSPCRAATPHPSETQLALLHALSRKGEGAITCAAHANTPSCTTPAACGCRTASGTKGPSPFGTEPDGA